MIRYLVHKLKCLKLAWDQQCTMIRIMGLGPYFLRRTPGCRFRARLPNSHEQFTWRTGTSDVDLIEDIFIQLQYACQHYPGHPETIIDAGANIGLTTLYYALRFPEARIIALEPDPSNFELLRENTKHLPNVILLNEALWSEEGAVQIINPDAESWAFRIGAKSGDDSSQTTATTIDALIKRFELKRIGILKMDIEGAEREVFLNAKTWIDLVDMLVVELHDCIQTGCARNFYLATANEHWVEYQQGENIFMVKRNRVEVT